MDTKVRTKDVQVSDEPSCSFEDLQLNPQLLEGLKSAGFFKPSPVQLKAIPLGKIGLDLIIQAKSGTGKTCVFAVIALEQILACKSKALQVLILAPTREVALQICSVIKSVSGHMNIKTQAFIGGQSVKEDKMKLKSCQIAVGTPGKTHKTYFLSQNDFFK
jgi:superfamily II DNA/RNA helicase